MTTATTLAELAVQHPAAARVFYRHRLDFCCGGRRSLADACRDRGLDPAHVLSAIEAETTPAPTVRWDEVPLPALVRYIVETYHQGLREALPDLVRMARRVEARHGDKPGCPRGLADRLEALHASVLEHLNKEENVVFPMLLSREHGSAAAPVHVLELEHEHHGEDLTAIRRMTDDLTPPEEACTTWRALYRGLQQLEQDLMEHIHLENNVLFRRALVA